MLNLLSNAFKFTFAGQITVSLQQRAGEVELAVRDTGIGIPADELPNLFVRFHRVQKRAVAQLRRQRRWDWPWCKSWRGCTVARWRWKARSTRAACSG